MTSIANLGLRQFSLELEWLTPGLMLSRLRRWFAPAI